MKLSILLSILSFVLIAPIIFLTFDGCSCGCGSGTETEVPVTVLQKANQFIIQRTSEEFFRNYISPDFNRTKKTPGGYYLVYRLIMPEKPFVNTVINFNVDSTGNVNKNLEVVGIPNCYDDECEFTINQEEAERIARDDGLKPGIKEWMTAFMWDARHDKYVWRILSVESETGNEENQNYKAKGNEYLINPNTGEIISRNEWNIR